MAHGDVCHLVAYQVYKLFFKSGIFAKLLNTICIFGCFQPGFEFFFISSGLDTVTYLLWNGTKLRQTQQNSIYKSFCNTLSNTLSNTLGNAVCYSSIPSIII